MAEDEEKGEGGEGKETYPYGVNKHFIFCFHIYITSNIF